MWAGIGVRIGERTHAVAAALYGAAEELVLGPAVRRRHWGGVGRAGIRGRRGLRLDGERVRGRFGRVRLGIPARGRRRGPGGFIFVAASGGWAIFRKRLILSSCRSDLWEAFGMVQGCGRPTGADIKLHAEHQPRVLPRPEWSGHVLSLVPPGHTSGLGCQRWNREHLNRVFGARIDFGER